MHKPFELNFTKSVNHLSLIFGFMITLLFVSTNDVAAQTKGLIVKPATGAGKLVMDPDGDGYISAKTNGVQLGFQTNDYNKTDALNESEIFYRPLPLPESEPMNDLARGPGGGFSDFADMNGTVYPVASILKDGNLMFRFRLGGIAPNSKGYSILVDSDGLFGNSGTTADPQFGVDNPGFEFEILLATNFAVRIYNVNNASGLATALTTDADFPYEQHCQKAIAYTTNSNDADYFYDFYVPFASLQAKLAAGGININTGTGLRMVANTVMAPQSAIKGPISDIGGINNANYSNPVMAWQKIVSGFVPTTPSGTATSSYPGVRSAAPVISGTILSNQATTINGTSSEPAGTTVSVFRNGVLLGTTTVKTDGTWTYPGTGTLTFATNDKITATATASASGKSESLFSNEIIVGTSTACGTRTATPVFKDLGNTCSFAVGFVIGTVPAGTSVKIVHANNPSVMLNTVNAVTGGTVATNPIPANEFWFKPDRNYTSCTSGSALAEGTYYVIAQEAGKCESLPLVYIKGKNTSTTCTGLTNLAVTQTEITNSTTTLSGSTSNGATTGISVFVDGAYYAGMQTTGTTWTLSNLVFAAGQEVSVYAQNGILCRSNAITFKVTGGQTAPPVINGPVRAEATTITGTSTEPAGTTIKLTYYAGNSITNLSGFATVGSDGTWVYSVSGVTLAANNSITATATAPTKTVSPVSGVVIITAIPPAIPAVPNVSLIGGVTYKEGNTTVSGNGPANTAINLYIDGAFLKTVTSDASGNWTVTGLSAANYDLYAGGKLQATSGTIGTNESTFSNNTSDSFVIVACNPPAAFEPVATMNPICAGDKEIVTISNSQSGTIYTIKDGTNEAGYSTLGTGGSISLYSFPLASAASPYSKLFTVTAQNIYSTNCSVTTGNTASVTVNPAPDATKQVVAPAMVAAGATASVTVREAQSGYIYQLRKGATNVGAAKTGTGSDLVFSTGPVTEESTFNVQVTDPTFSTNCTAQLSQTARVTIAPLPVELVNFTAKAAPNGVMLEWLTASEKNSDHFVVERSNNGREFMPVGKVKGSSTTNNLTVYNYLDNKQPNGTVYYRLKQVDFDGSFDYSKVVAVTAQKVVSRQVSIYPNPTSGNASLVISNAGPEKVMLTIFDPFGKALYSESVQLEEGSTIIPVKTQNLAAGMYLISVTGQTVQVTLKLQKLAE